MATKQLAKQLGLIRKSSKMSLHYKNGSSPKSKQFFEYLIIIDFESTCWKDAKHYGQEIIEFPAVLLNTSNGEIESEFHTYVQPQEHPILSDFCTELTGIKQQQVDEGVPLKICLYQFTSWIQKIQKEKSIVFLSTMPTPPTSTHKMCGFVTWSDWDLGVCLLYECKRKQLKKPDILNSWIDLRVTYKLFYSRKPKGLNGALQDLGIEFSGREHSGLDDSRNTARLAWRMICDGCIMKITKSLDKVCPKTSSARPPCVVQAKDCKSEQSNDTPTSTNGMVKNNKLPSERDTISICTAVSNIQNAKEPMSLNLKNKVVGVRQAEPVKVSKELQVQPQTLINGLSTTLGNGNKMWSSNRNSVGCLQNAIQIGTFTSTPIENTSFGPGHVLISTTVPSVNDISALDISSSSDCLSLLADWEDAAVIEDSQEETNDNPIQLEETNTLIGNFSAHGPLLKTNMENGKGFVNAKHVGDHSNSIAYRSPDTTIYNVNVKQQMQDCSTFKLPSALGSKFTNGLFNNAQQNGTSTSLCSFPKRKLASVSFYSPPKKQPFTIHEDQDSANNRSLPLTTSCPRGVTGTVLSSTMNSSIRVMKKGKMTAPLCKCGRRAKRLTVSSIGPNQGKAFYTCSVRKRTEENGKGCDYFKWEDTFIKEKSAHSSMFLSTSGLSFTSSKSFNSSASSTSHKSFVCLRPSMRT
ncbi:ERI1 exoribonuclease 2 [Rhinophrynus dorsalis]